jgi:hypothetical protein
MFGICGLYALLQSRRGADKIVDEAAHYIPMVRTSSEVLGMMLDGAESTDSEHVEDHINDIDADTGLADNRSNANDSGH